MALLERGEYTSKLLYERIVGTILLIGWVPSKNENEKIGQRSSGNCTLRQKLKQNLHVCNTGKISQRNSLLDFSLYNDLL